ncbi:probable palmitoyltransferase ZDHHC24 [Rhagoletis pomonella]|uniref:probable palmitoyltransferase ZDHHC24 n=1 Tax=Rhagoletis pomonella TaxID=28610 RepID=UPI00177CC5F5|nr:probable palmitoyltransferase ZDHHC24 [Rhagoletis pomonella]XP_036347746.1 probable palmitoyltransferase ZDHHC24 [Rhagoletis pomonella]
MKLRIRKRFFPRRLGDIFCFLLIVVFLPLVAFFDVVVVVPAIHTPGGFMHSFIFTIAMFMIFNINGNMFATMMVDTSLDAINLIVPEDASEKGWHSCERCKKLTPPRSYHCKVCKKCILKRDHHCVFTGCCVGHYNMRYFALFLVYMFVGSLLSFFYLSYYLFWVRAETFRHILSLFKMLGPILMVAHGGKWDNLPLLYYNLNIVALVISSILLVYHGIPIIRGGTSYERRFNYPYGRDFYSNLRTIFGKRMYLVWISPFIGSELLDDGANSEEVLDNAPLQRPSSQKLRNRVNHHSRKSRLD